MKIPHHSLSIPVWLCIVVAIKPIWHSLIAGYSEYTLFVWGTWLMGALMLFGTPIVMSFLEYYWKPSWLFKYKIQPDARPPTRQELEDAWFVAILNHIFVGFPLILVSFYLWKGTAHGPLPDWKTFIFDMLVFIIVEDILFYSSHRLFHHPKLYPTIHKMHHKWHSPCTISTTHAHPIEHLVANLTPLLAGPILMSSHLFSFWAWLGYGLYSTLHSHSGFHIPGGSHATEHDIHHQLLNCNYGIGIVDAVMGTLVTELPEKKLSKTNIG